MAEPAALTVRRARSLLARNASQIERTKQRLDDLYAERLAAWKVLTDDGVTQAEMADLAGVTPMAVAFALHKDRKRAANGV